MPRSCLLRAFAVVAAALLLVGRTPVATADEIVCRDMETGDERIVYAYEIRRENWSEIQYRARKKGPTKKLPTLDVVRIERSRARNEEAHLLEAGRTALERGNAREALRLFQNATGAGFQTDLDTGVKTYVRFSGRDSSEWKRKPPWWHEYAHFFQAKALWVLAGEADDAEYLQRALYALVDQPVPGMSNKTRSGGFLARFERRGGRWMPEAMYIAGDTLRRLGRPEEAYAAFQALLDKAVTTPIDPHWVQAARIGQVRVAFEAERLDEAIEAAQAATAQTRALLATERRAWAAREIGILHARAAAWILICRHRRAVANPSEANLRELRRCAEERLPEHVAERLKAAPEVERRALLAGALDSRARSFALVSLGWVGLTEKKFEEARLALSAVAARHFESPELHARALYYLAEACQGAAAEAEDAQARKALQRSENEARDALRAHYPQSEWAKR